MITSWHEEKLNEPLSTVAKNVIRLPKSVIRLLKKCPAPRLLRSLLYRQCMVNRAYKKLISFKNKP
jgi:hypothetical protein